MSIEYELNAFDPNGVGLRNGNFIGLPFNEHQSRTVILSLPWDVTVSYQAGTSSGPENILQASSQLDLYLNELGIIWKNGIYVRPSEQRWKEQNEALRPLAKKYIDFLENRGVLEENEEMKQILSLINATHRQFNEWVYAQCKVGIDQGKLIGILGGEHSVPIGLLRALSERYAAFGVLQIDAHMDLRKAYEGFEHSHASIFYNAMNLPQIQQLIQVGIRDMCEEEVQYARNHANRMKVYWDDELKSHAFEGKTWNMQCEEMIRDLPHEVYISFDIDGLNPELCPNTGTPVPGGLSFNEAIYLIRKVVKSGRKIIGFDLCEVGGMGNEWDGNVGARVLYRLAAWMMASQETVDGRS